MTASACRWQFEVFDAMDGLRVYSAVGPIKVTAIADSHVTSLRLSSTGRREVTSAFCAADRDPEKHRFATIRTFACLSGERDRERGDFAIVARMGRQRQYTHHPPSLPLPYGVHVALLLLPGDYFKHGHDPSYAAALSVRISVLDAKTGRMALLYDAR
jgi:hypothetical protein